MAAFECVARAGDGDRSSSSPAAASGHLRPLDGVAPSAAVHRVLLADDSDAIRLVLNALLSVEPDFVVVGEAADGAEALRVAETDSADLLVLDLAMPELDGLEVLEHLRVSRPQVRVAVYSGHNDAEAERLARELGARDFILKGTPPDELVERLRRAAGA